MAHFNVLGSMTQALNIRSISIFAFHLMSVLLGMVVEKKVLPPPLVQFDVSSLLSVRDVHPTFLGMLTMSR